MGYFSNGTEGDYYEAEFCLGCQHHSSRTGAECPVWLAHLLHAYEECGKRSAGEQILELLIPRNPDRIGNAKCAMHLPVVQERTVSSSQLSLIPEPS